MVAIDVSCSKKNKNKIKYKDIKIISTNRAIQKKGDFAKRNIKPTKPSFDWKTNFYS